MTKLKSTLYFLCILCALMAGLVLFMESSEAATYNFYFNNTEQGANSTASPTVTVNDGKKEGGETISLPAATPEETPPPLEPSVPEPALSGTVVQQMVPVPYFSHVRFYLGLANGGSNRSSTDATYSSTSGYSYNGNYWGESQYQSDTRSSGSSIQAGFTVFVDKAVGLSLLAGQLWGPELEIFPIRMEPHGISLGLLCGALGDNEGLIHGRYKSTARLGLELAANLAKHFELVAAARISPFNSDQSPAVTGGMAVLF